LQCIEQSFWTFFPFHIHRCSREQLYAQPHGSDWFAQRTVKFSPEKNEPTLSVAFMAASHLYSVRDHSPVHILLQKVWVRMVSGKNKSTNNVQKKEGFEVHTGLLFFDRYHRDRPANIIKYMHISHI
jgi:hypothetical protein